jgi:23S rRNA (uridine2552-2'-O)-methyltransferase
MTRRGGSSNRWRRRQQRDPYVKQAHREGWRSRAVFKLREIQERERILRPGSVCVDLGSSPGGWSQLAAKVLGESGVVVAVDVLPMDPIPNVQFILGDFMDAATVARVRSTLGDRSVDLVISDMAPNISGTRAVDQSRSLLLAESALEFATEMLKPGGDLLVKVFQGEDVDRFTRELREHFASVRVLKPKASRPESREIYLLARNYGM